MATLAAGGRISVELVDEEIERLRQQWTSKGGGNQSDSPELDGVVNPKELDRFDQAALTEVVKVCRNSNSLSDAGRTLFAVSRLSKAKPNDADRLRKYLARFGLSWEQIAR